MTTIHNLGFPRIGAKRELKFALESYWRGESSRDALKALGAELRQRHWTAQQELDWVPVGDFAFYDQVLDMSFTLGNLPERVQGFEGDALDNYFRVARGRSAVATESPSTGHTRCCAGIAAAANHFNGDFLSIRQHDGAVRQVVRRNGHHDPGRNRWMQHGAAG